MIEIPLSVTRLSSARLLYLNRVLYRFDIHNGLELNLIALKARWLSHAV